MTPALWKKVSEAWEAYFNLPADGRDGYLTELRGSDAELAAELETLLKQHAASQPFDLDRPRSEWLRKAAKSQPDAAPAGPVTVDHRPEPASQEHASTVLPDEDSSIQNAESATRLPGDMPAKAGRYVIEEKIGEGGMGAVLRVRDPDFDRTLAVKILLPKTAKNQDAENRFLEEARLTGQLQHPGIPPVHEIGRLEDGLPFFAMKLIRGETLSSLLKGREKGDGHLFSESKEHSADGGPAKKGACPLFHFLSPFSLPPTPFPKARPLS